MGAFTGQSFHFPTFDVHIDGVGPDFPPPDPPRGIPLNAYKQFKFIDSNGDPYYYRPEERYMLLDGD